MAYCQSFNIMIFHQIQTRTWAYIQLFWSATSQALVIQGHVAPPWKALICHCLEADSKGWVVLLENTILLNKMSKGTYITFQILITVL